MIVLSTNRVSRHQVMNINLWTAMPKKEQELKNYYADVGFLF